MSRSAWTLGGLVLASLLIYLRSVGGEFIWDDDANVTANPLLDGVGSLRRIWFSGEGYQYYPLTFTSYWLQDRLIGLSPRSCHLVNIGLHALNTGLLYGVLRQLRFPVAGAGALLFALHPVGVETVAWITERKNLLSGAFCLLSVIAFLRFLIPARSKIPPRSLYWLSWLAFVLAVLAKTHAVVLPAVLLVVCVWRDEFRRSRLLQLLPFFSVSALLSFVTIQLEARHVFRDSAGAEWELSWLEQLLNSGKILGFYVQKIFVPWELTFIYERWSVDATRWLDWIPLLIVAGVLAFLFSNAFGRRASRTGRASLAFFACYVLLLFPVLGLFDVYFMRYAYVQDHFQYFALMVAAPGVAGLMAMAMDRAISPARPRAKPREKVRAPAQTSGLYITIALVALCYAGLNWQHQADFRTLETLWTRTLAKNPRAWMAATNLGILKGASGDSDAAISLHRQAIAVDSTRAEPHNNLGFELARVGEHRRAVEAYERAILYEPNDPVAYFNLGNSLYQLERASEAIFSFERALRIEPEYPAAENSLGTALAATGRIEPAIAAWGRALAQEGEFLEAYTNLAIALTRSIGPEEANQIASLFCEGAAGAEPAFLLLLVRTRLGVGDREGAAEAALRATDALDPAAAGWLRDEVMAVREGLENL